MTEGDSHNNDEMAIIVETFILMQTHAVNVAIIVVVGESDDDDNDDEDPCGCERIFFSFFRCCPLLKQLHTLYMQMGNSTNYYKIKLIQKKTNNTK